MRANQRVIDAWSIVEANRAVSGGGEWTGRYGVRCVSLIRIASLIYRGVVFIWIHYLKGEFSLSLAKLPCWHPMGVLLVAGERNEL